MCCGVWSYIGFFFQAEDGIRDLVRSRGLGDVYKRQLQTVEVVVEHHVLGEVAEMTARRAEMAAGDGGATLSLIHI